MNLAARMRAIYTGASRREREALKAFLRRTKDAESVMRRIAKGQIPPKEAPRYCEEHLVRHGALDIPEEEESSE